MLKTQGNLNNEYGLPLTLLKLDEQHDAAVVELGMSHRGELALLDARLPRPMWAWLRASPWSIWNFSASIDEIALAERELIENLPWPNATAVLERGRRARERSLRRSRGARDFFWDEPAAEFRAESNRGARH